jgi:hypothetical protein
MHDPWPKVCNNMSGLRNTIKGGWHPEGKEGGKESWRGDLMSPAQSWKRNPLCPFPSTQPNSKSASMAARVVRLSKAAGILKARKVGRRAGVVISKALTK